MTSGATPPGGPLPIAVLASGRGSNLAALCDAIDRGEVPARVVLVLSDRADARAVDRARQRGLPYRVLLRREYPSREAYEAAVGDAIEAAGARLVCLAGFMRILGPAFVRRFWGRVMNVHPSLLPAFPGLDAQRQALEYGVRVSGCTVHFVDEGVDSGPIILQAAVPVEPDDTVETLSARILAEEHRLYPEAVRLFAEGRLTIEGRRVRILA